MLRGVTGRLVTASFVRERMWDQVHAPHLPPDVARGLAAWSERLEPSLGPASGVRAIADAAIVPLARLLGYTVGARQDAHECCTVELCHDGVPVIGVIVGPWRSPLRGLWRAAVTAAIAHDRRWWFCCNGVTLRIVDAHHTWTRASLDFDVLTAPREPDAARLLWWLAHAQAMAATPPLLDRAAAESARYGVEVCRALGAGVIDALHLLLGTLARSRRAPPMAVLLDQSLTVVYRILFLLFAEARGLVPIWHPIYRDRYSLDAIVTALASGRPYRGAWNAIQAISRMAHSGCRAGGLEVTAFNGRLFAPASAASLDAGRIDDDAMSRAITALSMTGTRRHGRSRIAYRDLDVEQLGAVYEQVLDFEPRSDTARPLRRTRDLRKASGTFYTPRRVTAFVVRHALEPLVRHRSADDILALRVLDPAMGSGAFLVAACRFLADAAEAALIRDGRWHPGDATPGDRAALRRDVASRCLFGVDLNPTAVQLARLSLWLATLAGDRPLSFLDHHLVAGDSLVGATPDDIRRQPGGVGSGHRHRVLPLFPDQPLQLALQAAVDVRQRLTAEDDTTPAVIRAKERALAALGRADAPLGRWSRVLDLWCAGWFWDDRRATDGALPAPDRAVFQDLVASLLGAPSSLAPRLAARYLERAAAIARRQRFLHWPLTFPEVFAGADGASRADGGFDAVIGNPPWDMIRGDLGDAATRRQRVDEARLLTGFIRDSGVYSVASRAHVNRYQLFVERALQLVRPGGRLGLVLPAGAASDAGAAGLRRHLFDRADVDSLTGLDNRRGIFPIHRSVRFALMTATAGRPTRAIACRFAIRDLDEMDAGSPGVQLTRAFLVRLSGDDDLGVPELASAEDLGIVERISASLPWLGSDYGWRASFGRELNASDDRASFIARDDDRDARPVVEGKHLAPFHVALDRCALALPAAAAASARVPRRARLAYRDVASATNRLTLIAAIVPARAVTTHTLFCLKAPLASAAQHVLCALLNSFVANYLVRLRVNTHVTAALMSRLPVPLVRAGDPAFETLLGHATHLAHTTTPVEDTPEYAHLQATVARLYRLTRDEFAHVLGTFPLMPVGVRQRALALFDDSHLFTGHGDAETRR